MGKFCVRSCWKSLSSSFLLVGIACLITRSVTALPAIQNPQKDILANESRNQAIGDWFKNQTDGDEPLTTDTLQNHQIKSYPKIILKILQDTGYDDQTLRSVYFINGNMVDRKKGKGCKRVLFKTKHDGQHFSRSEITLKLRDRALSHDKELKAVVSSTKKGRRQFTAVRSHGLLIFNISNMVDESTKRVRLIHLMSGRRRLNISQVNEPLLVTYKNMVDNPLLTRKRRVERDIRGSATMVPSPYCMRHDWDLMMELFRYQWYLHPMKFNAGYCKGICPVPLEANILNITNYSFIKHLYHAETGNFDQTVPRACCTPVAYGAQSMYYVNSDGHGVVSVFPRMRVTACGCR